jgi:hypothetical protein
MPPFPEHPLDYTPDQWDIYFAFLEDKVSRIPGEMTENPNPDMV